MFVYNMSDLNEWCMWNNLRLEHVDSLNYITRVFGFFYNQIRRFNYRSGTCLDTMLFTISTSYAQPIEWVKWVRLHTVAVYIEEKAVYMNNINGKTIQWETRKKSCSIINTHRYSICFPNYIRMLCKTLFYPDHFLPTCELLQIL